MKCRQYIFKLTSGQLDEAGLLERLMAAEHRLRCRRCRAFTRNDAALDDILAPYRAHQMDGPDAGAGAGAEADTAPPAAADKQPRIED